MQPDEPQLVDRSRDGDLSAFNAIVERYQSQVYNVSARILGDRHLAEDVAQETFIKAHRSIDGFRGGSLRAWLLRIASNLSLDATRSRKRRPAESLEAASERPGFSVPSGAPGPEQEALQGELREAIQECIMSLPDDQRAVVVLVDVQGLYLRRGGRGDRERGGDSEIEAGEGQAALERRAHGTPGTFARSISSDRQRTCKRWLGCSDGRNKGGTNSCRHTSTER